jgi:hypothetical protein
MTSIINFDPSGIAAKALFNFDDIAGSANFKLLGTVSFSVSDAFTKSSYNQFSFSPDVYTSAASGATNWTATQLANIQSILDTYSQFINLGFSKVNNYTGLNSAQVGERSDINLSLINRSNLSFAGLSAIDSPDFGYIGGELDIVLNTSGFGGSNTTLSTSTFGGRALMHEIGHSIGLSHPHSEYVSGKAVLTADFAATTQMGFSKLGFVINSAQDMNKEYFSIMSYDDQVPSTGGDTFAQTPMILDVLALQEAYGAGTGTLSASNDAITMGASSAVDSFRTYFDQGGIDTVNLANYSAGAYLNLGTTIVGAQYLVGVSMSTADRQLMLSGSSPQSLRWFYGEFENAVGSAGDDVITGNVLANLITGNGGNDSIDGGDGLDTAIYSGAASSYTIQLGSSNTTSATIADKTANRDGTDTLSNIERLKFLVADAVSGSNGVALDIGKDQTAGSDYMLYKAAFNRTPDVAGLGFWISKMDGGMSFDTVAQNFVNSAEFKTAFGGSNPSVNTLVTKLYNNVLIRNPDGGGLAFWQEKLSTGGWTVANVLGYFATSPENVTNVTPLIANGIPYQEWVG